LDYFNIAHIYREDNWNANELAQQASGYHVDRGVFHVSNEPMLAFANTGKAKSKPIILATNEGSSAGEDKDWRRPIVEYCRILVRGQIGLFGGWLSSMY
jgi:hypothetical protein